MHLFHYELAYAQCIVTTTNACCSMDFFVCPKEKKRILAIVQNAVKDLQANAKLCIPSIIHTKRPIAWFCLWPITLSHFTQHKPEAEPNALNLKLILHFCCSWADWSRMSSIYIFGHLHLYSWDQQRFLRLQQAAAGPIPQIYPSKWLWPKCN